MSPFVTRCWALHNVTRSITQCHHLSQDAGHFIMSHEASHNVTVCRKMSGFSLRHAKHHTMSPFVTRCHAFHYITRSITQCHYLSQDVRLFITSREASHNVTVCHKVSGIHNVTRSITQCHCLSQYA
jgi:hypothetical protein